MCVSWIFELEKAMATTTVTIDGQPYTAIVHLPKCNTKIKVTRAGKPDSDNFRDLELSGPILLVKSVKFPGMFKPAAALLLDPTDFKNIQDAVHAGAFGSDYCEVSTAEGPLTALWKLAADLNGIEGYEAVPVPVDVGTYPLYDDWRLCKFTAGGQDLVGAATTKMRFDYSHGGNIASVHHLELASPPNTELASISTDKFFEDFYKIDKNADEKERVQDMFTKLIAMGIRPLLCNSTQHQIVFLEHDEKVLTSRDFALLLNGKPELCQIIQGGLAGKGYGGAKFDDKANEQRFRMWKEDYIKTFGS